MKRKKEKVKKTFRGSGYTADSWEDNFYNSKNRTVGFVAEKGKLKRKPKSEVELDEMADKLRGKSYCYFLKSRYWEIVRNKVLRRDRKRCRKCKSKDYLQVHHKHYANHFREHSNLKDLITLCKCCHEKEHSDKLKLKLDN